MKNLIITVDEEIARWARTRAAEHDTSVPHLVGEMLRQKKLEEQSCQAVMQEYLSRSSRRLKRPGTRYPHRKELHDG